MNYKYEIVLEKYQNSCLGFCEIKDENNKVIMTTDSYADLEKARIAAQYFILSVKHARGEE